MDETKYRMHLPLPGVLWTRGRVRKTEGAPYLEPLHLPYPGLFLGREQVRFAAKRETHTGRHGRAQDTMQYAPEPCWLGTPDKQSLHADPTEAPAKWWLLWPADTAKQGLRQGPPEPRVG